MDADVLDLASRKLQAILKLNVFSRAEVAETVRLMSEISWSSTVTEQGHSAVAQVHRLHHRYSKENLVKHAFLRQVRPLFQPYVDRSARARAKLSALQKKNPNKCGGKALFLGQAISALAVKFPAKDRKGSAFGKYLLTEASRMWALLSREAQQDYALQALEQVPKNVEDLISGIAHQMNVAYTKAQNVTAEQSELGQLGRLSNVRFQNADMEALLDAYADWPHSQKDTAMMGLSFLQPPAPSPQLSRLEEFVVEASAVERTGPTPVWVKSLCHGRDICANAGLMFRHGEPSVEEFFAIEYIVKSPQVVVVAPMASLGIRLPQPARGETFQEFAGRFQELPRHNFSLAQDFAPDWEINVAEDAKVFVVPALQRLGIESASTDHDPVPIEEWCPAPPREAPARASGSGGSQSRMTVLDGNPWLRDLCPELFKHTQASGGGASSSHGHAGPSVSAYSISEERAEIFKELENKRRDWLADYSPVLPPTAFKALPLGGVWTKLNTEGASDKIRAWACTKDSQAFCKAQGLQDAKVWTVRTYGHEKWSAALAWHWARKMQYFYNVADGHHRHKFSRAEIEGAPVMPEALDGLPMNSPVREAVKVLAVLQPGRQRD
ncbi:MAG: hypothetical protein K0U16_07815 [Gammaproteobacteria bacterium]|nr:hypothetical protein [Gammaproteobacteria bacterium]